MATTDKQLCSDWRCRKEIPSEYTQVAYKCTCGKTTTVRRNAGKWIEGLVIDRNTYEDPPLPIPFTVEDLVMGKAYYSWGYRQVWPNTKWQLKDLNGDMFPDFERKFPLIADTRKRWLNEAEGHKYADNHQTMLIGIKGHVYYVMFHDGHILIGDTAREE